MDVHQLEKLMQNLVIEETRTNSLDLLKTKLVDVDAEIYEVMLQTATLFQFLAGANSEQTDKAARIIFDKAVSLFPNGSIAMDRFVERCLTHPTINVKQFGLRGACLLVLGSVPLSSNNVQLLIQHCLPMNEVSVTTLMKIFSKSLPAVFTDPGVQTNLQKLLECNETIRCRVYEIVCKILEKRPDLLPAADPILKHALADLDKNDVLLQTSVLSILTQLLVTEEGFGYVEEAGLFRKVYTNFVDEDVNPFWRLVLPNALKFYANSASAQPTLFLKRYPETVDFILDKVVTDDPMLMAVAFNCLGILGSTNEGKIYLSEHQKDKMGAFLKQVPTILHSTVVLFKVRFIESLITLLSAEAESIDNRISTITQNWYETMNGRKDLQFVLDIFKVPFADMKMASLKLLSVIVGYRWGQMFFENTACFLEMLLNRTLDVDDDVTQYKYDVIKKLSHAKSLDSFVCATLRQYVSEGAFFRKANVEVVVEDGQ